MALRLFILFIFLQACLLVRGQEASILPAAICIIEGSTVGDEADLVHQRSFQGVAVTTDGDVLVSEWNSGYILRVESADKCLMPVKGSSRQWQRKGYLTTSAGVTCPRGIAVDRAGNIYVAQYNGHIIRRIAPGGESDTIAGTGVGGYSGDGGPARAARISAPNCVAIDDAGNLLFTEEGNHIVRRVSADGVISTIAGVPGRSGYSGDHGLAVSALLNQPYGIAVGKQGDLFLGDTKNNVVRRVDADGVITTYAGAGEKGYTGDGGAATAARLNAPHGVAVTGKGELLIADEENNVIRRVAGGGGITTWAGSGIVGKGKTKPVDVLLLRPRDIAVDKYENVYILDFNPDLYRRIHLVGDVQADEQDEISISEASDRYIQVENCRYNTVSILDMRDNVISQQDVTARTFRINISMLKPGNYVLEFKKRSRTKTVRFTVAQ